MHQMTYRLHNEGSDRDEELNETWILLTREAELASEVEPRRGRLRRRGQGRNLEMKEAQVGRRSFPISRGAAGKVQLDAQAGSPWPARWQPWRDYYLSRFSMAALLVRGGRWGTNGLAKQVFFS
jgi:hypothetical protein